MSLPCLRLLWLVLCLLSWPTIAAGAGLDLVFAADLAGHFSPRRCRGPDKAVGPGLPALAGAVAKAKEEAQAAGAATLVIGGAGLLGPGNLSRFLLSSEEGSRHAARLLSQAGFEILAPGTYEFASDPAGLSAYLRAQRTLGRRTILSNMKHAPLGAFAPSAIIDRGGVRVGLVSVLAESLPRRVGKDHVTFTMLPPTSVAGEVQRLRTQERVQVVIIVSELDTQADPARAVALIQELEELGAHADVVLSARQDHPRAAVSTVTLSSGTIIVGAPSGGAGITRVSLSIGERGLQVSTGRVSSAPPDPSLAAEVSALQERMCRAWGTEVALLPAKGLSRDDLLTVVLDAMRALVKAEIALINTGALDDRGLPLLSASEAAVNGALPFPARVVRIKATGKAILDHLKRYAPKAGLGADKALPPRRGERGPMLHVRGLLLDGGTLKVNGRPLDPAATYRIATIDFVAAGGDELLPTEFAQHDLAARPISIQQLVLDYLKERQTVDPIRLGLRPLWTTGLDLGMDLQSVTVSTPEGVSYDRPLLLRRPAVSLKLDASARIQLDHPAHLLQLSVRGTYGQTYFSQTPGKTDEPSWQETTDVLSGLLLYSYRGLVPRFRVVPTPFGSIGLDTEWSRPEQRDYLHLELSAVGGLRTALGGKLSLSGGVGVRQELLARAYSPSTTEADLARLRFLFSTTLELQKTALWPRLGNALLGELSLTYNFTDPDFLRSHELRTAGKLYVALGRPLYLTLGLDLYLYGDPGRDPGTALDVTAGIKVLMDARNQVF